MFLLLSYPKVVSKAARGILTVVFIELVSFIFGVGGLFCLVILDKTKLLVTGVVGCGLGCGACVSVCCALLIHSAASLCFDLRSSNFGC